MVPCIFDSEIDGPLRVVLRILLADDFTIQISKVFLPKDDDEEFSLCGTKVKKHVGYLSYLDFLKIYLRDFLYSYSSLFPVSFTV